MPSPSRAAVSSSQTVAEVEKEVAGRQVPPAAIQITPQQLRVELACLNQAERAALDLRVQPLAPVLGVQSVTAPRRAVVAVAVVARAS